MWNHNPLLRSGSFRKPGCSGQFTRLAPWLLLLVGILLLANTLTTLSPAVIEYVFRAHQRSELAFLALLRGKDTVALHLEEWARASPRRACLLDLPNALNATSDAAGDAIRDLYAKRARCCMRSLQAEIPLGLSRRNDAVLRLHGFSRYMRSFLPEETVRDNFPGGFKTCSVVSSAPSLRRSPFVNNSAAEIDSADAVFRLNVAPVAGYEKWVGSKETIRLVNLHLGVTTNPVVKEAYRTRGRTVFIRDEQHERARLFNTSRAWNIPRLGANGALNMYLARRREFPEGSIYLNHPVFSELSMRFLHMSLLGGNPRSLSTGAQGVVLAMMMCDKVVSFEVTTDDPTSKEWKYYWSGEPNSKGYGWWHPFREEAGLLRLLSTKRRPNSTIYEYDMAENDNSHECRAYLDSFL